MERGKNVVRYVDFSIGILSLLFSLTCGYCANVIVSRLIANRSGFPRIENQLVVAMFVFWTIGFLTFSIGSFIPHFKVKLAGLLLIAVGGACLLGLMSGIVK